MNERAVENSSEPDLSQAIGAAAEALMRQQRADGAIPEKTLDHRTPARIAWARLRPTQS